MGIDIIIPLAKDKSYIELRYALRSIDANLSGHRNIYLIGEKPSWITNVIHIPCNDIFHRKQLSIFRKLMFAAKDESVSNNFIRWDDDVYLLEPWHVKNIKDWHNGTLQDWANKPINSGYREVIKRTAKLFPSGLYYDIHAPRIFNKQRYRELNKFNWSSTELLTKSTYFNSGEASPVEMKDPKRHPDLFASSNGAVPKEVRDLFVNPCKYES